MRKAKTEISMMPLGRLRLACQAKRTCFRRMRLLTKFAHPAGKVMEIGPDHTAAVDQNRDRKKPNLVAIAELSGVAAHKRRGDAAGARAPSMVAKADPYAPLSFPVRTVMN